MIKTTYYKKNRDVILNRAKDYYENDKKRLIKEKAKDKYRNLSGEEKNKKKQIPKCVWRKETKTKEYQKNYREAKTSQYNNN